MRLFICTFGQVSAVEAPCSRICVEEEKHTNQGVNINKLGQGFIKNRISIDERPEVVDDKSRVGDWKIDLFIGKGHSGALVTIVERKTSFTVSAKIDDKPAKTETATTITLLKTYEKAVLANSFIKGCCLSLIYNFLINTNETVYSKSFSTL
jgi:IS30 family transposase